MTDHNRIKGIFFLALFLFASPQAFSSPCCAGSGGQSLCVVPSEQNYQLGFSTSFRKSAGRFDPYGIYFENKEKESFDTFTTTFGAALRLNEDWQASLTAPFVRNQQTLSNSVSRSATRPSDPTLEVRYTFWEDLAFLTVRPQILFLTGLKFPFGTSLYSSKDATGTDITGGGLTVLHAGFQVGKLYRPFKLALSGTFFYPLGRTISEIKSTPVPSPYLFKAGNQIQLQESFGFIVNDQWSATLGLKQFWAYENSMKGEAVSGSASRLFASSIGINYFYDASWTFGVSAESVFPFYAAAVNQLNASTVTLAATYGGL